MQLHADRCWWEQGNDGHKDFRDNTAQFIYNKTGYMTHEQIMLQAFIIDT